MGTFKMNRGDLALHLHRMEDKDGNSLDTNIQRHTNAYIIHIPINILTYISTANRHTHTTTHTHTEEDVDLHAAVLTHTHTHTQRKM